MLIIQLNTLRTLANFLLIDIVDQVGFYVDGRFGSTYKLQSCNSIIRDKLGFDISAEYVRRYVKPETRDSVIQIAEYIRKQLSQAIDESKWVSSATKLNAKDKLTAMKVNIAYTDKLMNQSLIDEIYAGLELEEDNFLANILKLKQNELRRESATFHKKLEERAWESFADTMDTNAIYYPSSNSLNVLAGYLTEIHFDPELEKYIAFGITGSTIGHEMMHAFDPSCVRHDSCGNIRRWWDDDTYNQYGKRSRCLHKQYDGLPIPLTDLKLNGFKTLNENIADNVGYSIAYRAYLDWANSFGKGHLLSDMNFNQNQLFWISLATKRCEQSSSQRMQSYSNDSHAPSRFRVNVPLMNSKEFSSDFNCPIGSPMNPKDKCEFW